MTYSNSCCNIALFYNNIGGSMLYNITPTIFAILCFKASLYTMFVSYRIVWRFTIALFLVKLTCC